MTRLGNSLDFGEFFLKPLATINLPKSITILGNFCKGVKIYHFWATFIDIWRFFSGHTGWNKENGVGFDFAQDSQTDRLRVEGSS